MAAVGRLPGALGPEVEQPAVLAAQLGEGEPAAVADLGIVHPELVAMIAQRQRLGEVFGKRLEPAEVPYPSRVVEFETDAFAPALVEEARSALRKARRLDDVIEVGAEGQDLRVGAVARH